MPAKQRPSAIGSHAPAPEVMWSKLLALESRFNSLVGGGGVPAVARKPAGTSRSSTTTTDDPDLQLPLLGGVFYLIEMWIWVDGAHAPGDMKWRWYTGDNSGVYSAIHNEGGSIGLNNSGIVYSLGDFASLLSLSGVGVQVAMWFRGVATPASNTNLIFQWAVNTAAAGNTTIHGSSWMAATPVP